MGNKNGSLKRDGDRRAASFSRSNDVVAVADLDQVFSHIGFGAYQYRLVAILCVGNMADAMEVTLLSFLSPCAQEEFNLTGFETSFLTGIVFLGEVAGALFFGKLADLKGRRLSYAWSLMVMLVFGVGTFFTTNYVMLVVCRSFVGFGLGGGVVPFDYVTEAVPVHLRGKACMLEGICWGLGSMFTAGIAWAFLDSMGWRFLALLVCTPVLLAFLSVFTIIESPRWLLAQGRKQEAEQALKVMAASNNVDLGEFFLNPYENAMKQGELSRILKGSLYRKTILLSVIWGLASGFAYYVIVLVISKIFEVSDSCSFNYVDIFVSTCSEPFFMILGVLYVEKSRCWSAAFNYFTTSAVVLLLGFSFNEALLMVFAFLARGAIRTGSAVSWTQTPELYPTEIRSSAHAVFYIISRLGSYGAAYWAYADLDLEIIVGVVALATLISAFVSLMLPETAGVALDEVQIETPIRHHGTNYDPFKIFRRQGSMESSDDQRLESLVP